MKPPFKLNATLGRTYNADLNDVLRTKQALSKLGHFEAPTYGMTEYPDEPLFQGIETFQIRHGLRRDGVMKPDGETVAKLGQVLAEQRLDETRAGPNVLGLSGEIGLGRANKPHDVFALSQALTWAGFPTQPTRASEADQTEADLPDAIKGFQKSAGLKVDGWLRPYGETEEALNSTLAPKAQVFLSSHEGADAPPGKAGFMPDGGEQQAMAFGLIPPIAYAVAEFFGISLLAAWAWWQSMDSAQQEKVRKQIATRHSNDEDDDLEARCEYLYEVDTDTCNGITRNRGKVAGARCHETAASRYEACRRGIPIDRLPPLNTWMN
ncbi:hypothetical protein KFF05_01180 [bacterium SCSIO 12827]|nr:hypothetical protein KFF05_01180 [bacterium SCSIO 12827]